MKSFHGLVNFYKKFIRNFSGISAHLTDCTRGKIFSWTKAAPVSFAEVQTIVNARCVLCHNAEVNNKGVMLHTPELIAKNAQAMYQQAVVLKAMPFGNATQMTAEERAALGRWFEAGAKVGASP